jgi:hypothetical protein
MRKTFVRRWASTHTIRASLSSGAIIPFTVVLNCSHRPTYTARGVLLSVTDDRQQSETTWNRLLLAAQTIQ